MATDFGKYKRKNKKPIVAEYTGVLPPTLPDLAYRIPPGGISASAATVPAAKPSEKVKSPAESEEASDVMNIFVEPKKPTKSPAKATKPPRKQPNEPKKRKREEEGAPVASASMAASILLQEDDFMEVDPPRTLVPGGNATTPINEELKAKEGPESEMGPPPPKRTKKGTAKPIEKARAATKSKKQAVPPFVQAPAPLGFSPVDRWSAATVILPTTKNLGEEPNFDAYKAYWDAITTSIVNDNFYNGLTDVAVPWIKSQVTRRLEQFVTALSTGKSVKPTNISTAEIEKYIRRSCVALEQVWAHLFPDANINEYKTLRVNFDSDVMKTELAEPKFLVQLMSCYAGFSINETKLAPKQITGFKKYKYNNVTEELSTLDPPVTASLYLQDVIDNLDDSGRWSGDVVVEDEAESALEKAEWQLRDARKKARELVPAGGVESDAYKTEVQIRQGRISAAELEVKEAEARLQKVITESEAKNNLLSDEVRRQQVLRLLKNQTSALFSSIGSRLRPHFVNLVALQKRNRLLPTDEQDKTEELRLYNLFKSSLPSAETLTDYLIQKIDTQLPDVVIHCCGEEEDSRPPTPEKFFAREAHDDKFMTPEENKEFKRDEAAYNKTGLIRGEYDDEYGEITIFMDTEDDDLSNITLGSRVVSTFAAGTSKILSKNASIRDYCTDLLSDTRFLDPTPKALIFNIPLPMHKAGQKLKSDEIGATINEEESSDEEEEEEEEQKEQDAALASYNLIAARLGGRKWIEEVTRLFQGFVHGNQAYPSQKHRFAFGVYEGGPGPIRPRYRRIGVRKYERLESVGLDNGMVRLEFELINPVPDTGIREETEKTRWTSFVLNPNDVASLRSGRPMTELRSTIPTVNSPEVTYYLTIVASLNEATLREMVHIMGHETLDAQVQQQLTDLNLSPTLWDRTLSATRSIVRPMVSNSTDLRRCHHIAAVLNEERALFLRGQNRRPTLSGYMFIGSYDKEPVDVKFNIEEGEEIESGSLWAPIVRERAMKERASHRFQPLIIGDFNPSQPRVIHGADSGWQLKIFDLDEGDAAALEREAEEFEEEEFYRATGTVVEDPNAAALFLTQKDFATLNINACFPVTPVQIAPNSRYSSVKSVFIIRTQDFVEAFIDEEDHKDEIDDIQGARAFYSAYEEILNDLNAVDKLMANIKNARTNVMAVLTSAGESSLNRETEVQVEEGPEKTYAEILKTPWGLRLNAVILRNYYLRKYGPDSELDANIQTLRKKYYKLRELAQSGESNEMKMTALSVDEAISKITFAYKTWVKELTKETKNMLGEKTTLYNPDKETPDKDFVPKAVRTTTKIMLDIVFKTYEKLREFRVRCDLVTRIIEKLQTEPISTNEEKVFVDMARILTNELKKRHKNVRFYMPFVNTFETDYEVYKFPVDPRLSKKDKYEPTRIGWHIDKLLISFPDENQLQRTILRSQQCRVEFEKLNSVVNVLFSSRIYKTQIEIKKRKDEGKVPEEDWHNVFNKDLLALLFPSDTDLSQLVPGYTNNLNQTSDQMELSLGIKDLPVPKEGKMEIEPVTIPDLYRSVAAELADNTKKIDLSSILLGFILPELYGEKRLAIITKGIGGSGLKKTVYSSLIQAYDRFLKLWRKLQPKAGRPLQIQPADPVPQGELNLEYIIFKYKGGYYASDSEEEEGEDEEELSEESELKNEVLSLNAEARDFTRQQTPEIPEEDWTPSTLPRDIAREEERKKEIAQSEEVFGTDE